MKAGIHTIPAEDYHADPGEQPSLSASIAHLLYAGSPKHAWTAHPRLNPDFEPQHETRFDIGNTAHALLLEKRAVEDIVVIVDAPDWRTNAAKEARDEARANGKTPLLGHHVDGVKAMLDAAREQLDSINVDPPLFVDGKPEQTLIWQEGEVTCRSLIDWLHDDYGAIDDFKTTSASANPDYWTARTLFQIGADIQMAFHLRGVRAITGVDAVMRYVVQETYPPYGLSVVALGPAALAVADAKVEFALARWRECLAADEWPGYPAEVCYADLPSWEETRLLEKEAREDVAA